MNMKIVVIGGSGLIGKKLVNKLRESGHEVVAASRSSGVNTLTGVGLSEALEGAAVVVDVTDSPSYEDAAVLNFFETSTRNPLRAEVDAGVGHHVALSVLEQPITVTERPQVIIQKVELAPGYVAAPHRHPGPVFGYVL
jgi:uncharacterized protein YbjT (DUF2867 family)